MTFKERIKIIFSDVWDFLKPILIIFLSQSGKILAEIALKAVAEVANQSISGEIKRQIVFNKIQEELRVRGIELTSSAINMAIEVAYQKYLEKQK